MCEEYTEPAEATGSAPDPQIQQLAEENRKLREQLQQKRKLSFQSSFFWV